ncbi:hypothetical protein UFOVP1644_1, partial [uncultured Caudovirales phage]
PDADRENMEKLAAAAKEANARGGHNSEPTPDAIRSAGKEIEVALVEIDAAARIMQSARSKLATARKVSKSLLGSKGWVDSVEEAVKQQRAGDKGGMGGIVTEHRQIGVAMRAMGCPLYTQFNLFAVAEHATDPSAPKDEKSVEREAWLAGEHAGMNGEPKGNNPHQGQPGSPKWFEWNNGWQAGADKLTDSFKTGGLPVASDSAPAH